MRSAFTVATTHHDRGSEICNGQGFDNKVFKIFDIRCFWRIGKFGTIYFMLCMLNHYLNCKSQGLDMNGLEMPV